MHEARYTIRSTQVDSLGHMNNAAYLEVFEWARWEWALAQDMDLEDMIQKRRIGPAVLHVDLSFLAELVMHEEISVRTWVEDLERVKGVMGQEMIKADGTVAALMYMTFAMFNLDKRHAVGLPDEIRTAHEADAEYRVERAAGGKGRKYKRSKR